MAILLTLIPQAVRGLWIASPIYQSIGRRGLSALCCRTLLPVHCFGGTGPKKNHTEITDRELSEHLERAQTDTFSSSAPGIFLLSIQKHLMQDTWNAPASALSILLQIQVQDAALLEGRGCQGIMQAQRCSYGLRFGTLQVLHTS